MHQQAEVHLFWLSSSQGNDPEALPQGIEFHGTTQNTLGPPPASQLRWHASAEWCHFVSPCSLIKEKAPKSSGQKVIRQKQTSDDFIQSGETWMDKITRGQFFIRIRMSMHLPT